MAPPSRRTSLNSNAASTRRSSLMQKCHGAGWDDSIAAPGLPQLDPSDSVEGYEELTFESTVVPPPDSIQIFGPLRQADCWRHSTNIPGTENLAEKQARTHLKSYVSKHSCYGKAPVKTMIITDMQSFSTFHYQLDSFVEMREVAWVFEAWNSGLPVEERGEGQAPLPWEIEVEPERLFQDEVRVIQVPHTSVLKSCHRCFGVGTNFCNECKGKGWIRCLHCHGDGFTADSEYRERCFYCRASNHGYGRMDCNKCRATGKMGCPQCENSGLIICYIQLTVTWKVNSSEFILERTGLPRKLISEVSGEIVFNEQNSIVGPISDFPEEAMVNASNRLIKKHHRLYADQYIICQRQRIRVVPVALIKYTWKGHDGEFFVYGIEKKVHAPDYPQTCCWGCIII
nr:PREDICTED: protein SSUH2 homolog isoform X1 [Bemisia tabaci]